MTDQPTRPNVLFIMDDQHRHDYLGAAGSDFIRTPNIDRLARNGVRFTQCTTNCPICVPSRIGLASGLLPSRIGSIDNDSYLPLSAATFWQHFRDYGYRVGCVGKLDLAKPDQYNGRHGDRPCVFGWGFTHPIECEGKMHAGNHPTPQGPYGFWLQQQGLYDAFHKDYRARNKGGWIKHGSHDSVLPTDAFEDAYIGRRAAEWIEQVPDDFPWHLFVSFVGPHDPFDPPGEYAERYRGKPMPPAVRGDLEGKSRRARSRQVGLTDEQVAHARRQYCAATELIDDQVGAILEALDRRGMADNTIIAFASDHGEMLGDHGIFTKSVGYEAAIRVPLVVAGPGIEPGRTSDALVELIDVNPTLTDLAGLPAQPNLDARSLGPVLRGQASEHRQETISVLKGFGVVRTDRYKLIDNENDVAELYDLASDPHECHSVAAAQPDIVRQMRKRLRERLMEGQWRR